MEMDKIVDTALADTASSVADAVNEIEAKTGKCLRTVYQPDSQVAVAGKARQGDGAVERFQVGGRASDCTGRGRERNPLSGHFAVGSDTVFPVAV